MKTLLACIFASLLAGCANTPLVLDKAGDLTVKNRQALHQLWIEHARETLREAADWQQLNTPLAPITKPPAAAAP